MILIGLGSNMNGPWGTPEQTLKRTLLELAKAGVPSRRTSRLIKTAPFGKLDQPPFVNAVAEVTTYLPPDALLRKLHTIERRAGRRRGVRWGPRTLDLDLLDYHGLLMPGEERVVNGVRRLILPHPGIAERPFVLSPI